ncbi:hypothetical protein [Arthrobacter sp. B1I2]|uniref:hypothetical protein n=1 Tax=Arthrobacter sp. B1I2 TaxID=3042263 RepID=UPI00277EE621|nr:hypothetical protein [Arthrobacter sp. B1I2]MDQ0731143.1 hypothetical protein [Arthrobacter sp. B1I2]
MMELMDGGRRRRRLPKREPWSWWASALSVTAAAVLLPAIGLKALATALPLGKNPAARPDPDDSYLLN